MTTPTAERIREHRIFLEAASKVGGTISARSAYELLSILDAHASLLEEVGELKKDEEAAYKLMMKEQARAKKAEAELEKARPLLEAAMMCSPQELYQAALAYRKSQEEAKPSQVDTVSGQKVHQTSGNDKVMSVEEALEVFTQTGAIYLIATYKDGDRGLYDNEQVNAALATLREATKPKEAK